MTGSSSPCGACKFLRRKCVKGCVFEPYFSHDQGASQFAAIHKVFGASNVSKLLCHLPVSDRSKAALTISYEAQARVHDPVYGCISHIYALQQQVVNLQAQLAYLRQQTGQSQFSVPILSTSPNLYNQSPGNHNLQYQMQQMQVFNQTHLTHLMNMPSMESSENSSSSRRNAHAVDPYSCSYDDTNSQALDEKDERYWNFEDTNDLRSIAFRYM